MSLVTTGPIYSFKCKYGGYSPELKKCIENTVSDLLKNITTPKKPGMLLGKVQAGKTFAYSGIMALAFDNGFDIVVILTKGTKFLLNQTLIRMINEFNYFVKDDDSLDVFDIMKLPKLTGYQLQKKLILLVKKEDDNLKRLNKTFTEAYPDFIERKTLIIDDEADYASIGFRRSKSSGFRINTTTKQLSALRNKIKDCDYLQVTATPYSLYLQPDDFKPTGYAIAPMRPVFTHIVPTHNRYIGAEHFYGVENKDRVFSRLMGLPHISNAEITVLNSIKSINLYTDFNYAKYYLSENGIPTLWGGLLAFITGAVIRRIQEFMRGNKVPKYAFVIHTDTRKDRHNWQYKIVDACLGNLIDIAIKQPNFFEKFVNYFYSEFLEGMSERDKIPQFEEVNKEVIHCLVNGYIGSYQVNSDSDAETLLDYETGQLRLINPMNVYIGGYIFDRGVTIDNLIGFYYCRNPRSFQQDTVIQHQRIFGTRSIEDLVVTRFYTSITLFDILQRMHDFDTCMWKYIETNGTKAPLYFIGQFKNIIRPCSPNKLLLSTILTIFPGKRILPTGFQTLQRENQLDLTSQIDEDLTRKFGDLSQINAPIQTVLSEIIPILRKIWKSFVFVNGYQMNVNEIIGVLTYISKQINNNTEEITIILRNNREISRIRSSTGRFEDAPDTAKGESSELQLSRKFSMKKPVLILLRENGRGKNGWNDAPFYWPIIIVPQHVRTFIYSEIK